MSEPRTLARLEAVVDRAAVAIRVELALPIGGRPRQLPVRTLLLGILLALADGRPAHLTRVHHALVALPEADQRRLQVLLDWAAGPHQLTYRQVERTYRLVVRALAKDLPNGTPSAALSQLVDALLEASVPEEHKTASSALAIDWSDHETFSNPPAEKGGPCADDEAAWGHRRGGAPGQKHELFYGYYLQAATMVNEETGPPVPELARRISLTACDHDPVRAFLPVLANLTATGVALGDVLADSGYAHRDAEAWALPLRQLGAALVTDLHPHDRGPKGTHAGAVISNGNLYCPATPRALLELGPLARGASEQQTADHDRSTTELSHYKLGRITNHDADGYHRVTCPATTGKLRCPRRGESMTLGYQRPEVLTPPEPAPVCCTQRTITVPPEVTAKTAQKHDYPSRAHRASYARRSAAERTFATAKDPASNDINRGWCRLMGLTAITVFAACLFVVRNERILTAYDNRQADNTRRLTAGLPPRTRRRRRRTLADLVTAATPP
ncbi:MAG TPA: hypothetical protein VNG13_07640 [Mycobacteriales bacterium]|nr:hypothetical protein [Mycobacteriales bacterium]